MNKQKIVSLMRYVAPTVALLMIFSATITPFFLSDWQWAQEAYIWVYVAGAVLLIVSAFFQPRDGSMRLRRLRRLDGMAGLVFGAGAFFLLYHDMSWGRDWIAFTLAGAVIKIYTSLMLPRVERKEEAQTQEK